MKIMKIIKSDQIESRLMHSMRNDMTRVAPAATVPEMVRKKNETPTNPPKPLASRHAEALRPETLQTSLKGLSFLLPHPIPSARLLTGGAGLWFFTAINQQAVYLKAKEDSCLPAVPVFGFKCN